MRIKNDHSPVSLNRSIFLLSFCLALNGCFLAVPYIETDRQARECKVCNQTASVTSLTDRSETEPRLIARKGPLRRGAGFSELTDKLVNGNEIERTHAAFELGEDGQKASGALPLLSNAIRYDRSSWVRRAAVKAVEKIDPAAAQKILPTALGDSDRWVVHSARNALRRLRAGSSRLALSPGDSHRAQLSPKATLPPVK